MESEGLSPCVRGNLILGYASNPAGWSIPVCTGEPVILLSVTSAEWVYPRVYGGTGLRMRPSRRIGGLSPCVRGNPRHSVARGHGGRSIPVCTGEPGMRGGPLFGKGVYPRVYGGTSTEFIRLFAAMSLFPGV